MSHSSYYSQAAHQNITENRANTEDDHHRVYEPPLDQCECQKELFNDHSADLDIWVFCVHYIYLMKLYVFFKQSMEVPQTPLHTSRVLKEEKDTWEDVKVRSRSINKAECILISFRYTSHFV